MNIPIREMLDDEQNLKRTMTFEFEVGYYDQSRRMPKGR